MHENGGGSSTTPMNIKSRIRRFGYEEVWYALDTNSPEVVHKKLMHEFWSRESKDVVGSKKDLWNFCFGEDSRKKLWENMSSGYVDETRSNLSKKEIEDLEGEVNTPSCPSSGDESECSSYNKIMERKERIANTYKWESQVVDVDGKEVEQVSISRYLLNKFFPMPQP